MNRKWIKLSALAAMAALAGLVVFSQSAAAQGAQPPQTSMRGRNASAAGIGVMMRGRAAGRDASLAAVAATTLNVSRTDLVAALNTGKTIANMAAEKGVALDKIVDAFIAPRVTAINNAVAAGRITQAQADAMIAAMKANVTAQLNAAWTPRGNGNGLCDGTGSNFVDNNGDGVCDNQPAWQNRPANRGGGRWNR